MCLSRPPLATLLAAEGRMRVEAISHGQEALARLAQSMPDFLVLEACLPDVDGFEILRQLRADKRAMNLSVLVVTSKEVLASEEVCLTRHLVSLLSKKEASLEHLGQMIQHLLGSAGVPAAA